MSSNRTIEITLEVVGIGGPHSAEPARYLVRKRSGSFKPIELVWTDALKHDLEEVRKHTPDRVKLAAIGERLAPFLAEDVERILAAPEDLPVRISIQLQSVSPEMGALPWELITLGEAQRTLASLPNCLIRYEVAGTSSQRTLPDPPIEGGRILFAYSTMGGGVPQKAQCEAILGACKAAQVPFDRSDVLANRPFAELGARLGRAVSEGRPYTILHLLCHGGMLASDAEVAGLMWGDERGQAIVVDPAVLADTLAPFARKGLRLVVISACLGGDAGTPGNPMRSVAERLHRAGIASVIASRFRLSIDGSKELTQVFYDRLLRDSWSVEEAFRAARIRVFELFAATTMDHAALQLWGRRGDGWDSRPIVFAPFRGLLPFERRHERFFFGRRKLDIASQDREVDELIREFSALVGGGRPRFMTIAGDSGTGKSSMVFAGALPELERQGWTWVGMRPGAAPQAQLDTALTGFPEGAQRLLVVDQFEEVFTSVVSLAERTAFVRRLWDLSRSSEAPRWSVIVVFRIDFLGRCGEIVLDSHSGLRLDRVACDPAHQVLVPQMDSEQLRLAIAGPVARVGLELAPGLTERILNDVDHEPGALPLVQHTLSLLWARREGRTLTQEAYDALGGVAGALNHHADGVIAGFAREGADHLRLARRLLTQIVHIAQGDTANTGRRTSLAALRPEGEAAADFDAVLAELVRQRLLVCSGDQELQTVEVAHEALIRKWGLLRRWIDEERGKLLDLEEFRGWEETCRKHGTMLNEGQLAMGEKLVREAPELLRAGSRALIERSQAEIRRVAEQGRRFRDTLRVTVAREYIDKDPGISAALLREVEARELIRVPSWFDCMGEVLRRPAMVMTVLEGHEERVSMAAWSPDQTRLLTICAGAPAGPFPEMMRMVLAMFPDRQQAPAQPGVARIWDALSGDLKATFAGHTDSVDAAVWSPDGRAIATASKDRTARIWDARTGTTLLTLQGHTNCVTGMAWSPDGARLATVGLDRSVRVWDSATGRLLATMEGPMAVEHHGIAEGAVHSVAWHPGGRVIATAWHDQRTRIWNAASGELLVTLDGHTGTVWSAIWNHNGSRLLTCSLDCTARVWDPSTGRVLAVLAGHTDNVCAAEWSADESKILTASWDRTARIWSATGRPLAVLEGHEDRVLAASWNADGTAIATASDDRTARIWGAAGGAAWATLLGHKGPVLATSWRRGEAQVVTASEDRTARVWTAGVAEAVNEYHGHEGPVLAAEWSPDGVSVVSTTFNTAQVWNTATLATSARLAGHTDLILGVAWCGDGSQVVTASADHTARVWDAASGETIAVCSGHKRGVCLATWSPRGDRILTASYDKTARIWDAVSGAQLMRFNGHTQGVAAAVWSPDGARIATVAESRVDRTARIWDATSGELTLTLVGHTERIYAPQWSPDGARLVTGSDDHTVKFWSADSGALLATGTGHESYVVQVAWNPDGTQIVSASRDGTARVWDAASGVVLAVLRGHDQQLYGAAWSPDGTQIVTASEDHSARVWDAATGEVLATLRGHGDQVLVAAWSLDGSKILTASSDNTARVWILGSTRLRNHLWRANPYCLSRAQRMRLLDEDPITAEANVDLALRTRIRQLQRPPRGQA